MEFFAASLDSAPIGSRKDRKFPPPLAIGSQFVKRGRDCCAPPEQMPRGVRLQAIRSGGRFLLQEVAIPSDRIVILHQVREPGRLVLRAVRRKSDEIEREEQRPQHKIEQEIEQEIVEEIVEERANVALPPRSLQDQALPKLESIATPAPARPLPPISISPPIAAMPSTISPAPRASDLEPASNRPQNAIDLEDAKKKKKIVPDGHVLQELCANRMARIQPTSLPYRIAVR